MKKLATISVFLFPFFILAQGGKFKSVKSAESSIAFNNKIIEDDSTNIMLYDYLYNGAGVGVGDFNRDGYPDLFFAGNMVDDQLYYNQAKMSFKNVTESAGISYNGWSTGVCVFDVNNDGWDDIYVCRSGPSTFDKGRKNVLYENQKDGSFKENAAAYGLDLSGYFTQAAPLDIDLDGDLDLYVMGHPGKFKHKTNLQEIVNEIKSGKVESDLLLENVGGQFIDITKESGIFEYGYGLGLAITDINLDGYPDILVCNDFDEPDHCFVNQLNNTFVDRNLNYFKHTSNYSMGNDVGDINNDGLLDYVSVDMAFEQHERSKTNMASMSPTKFYARVQLGWGYQYMHNMLQLNTGMGVFQEISQFAGVAKTDWSWAPLFLDIDMDGQLDLFVSNGYKRDTKNNDIGFLLKEAQKSQGDLSIKEFLEIIPSVRIENFFYKNSGELKFIDKRADWGVDEKLNTNGAVYVDLDLDGDLDMVFNNVDTLASVYENNFKPAEHKLIIDLTQIDQTILSGAKIFATTESSIQIRECHFIRGYCSTVEKKVFFYHENEAFESLTIQLSNGKKYSANTALIESKQIKLDDELSGFTMVTERPERSNPMFKEVTDEFRLDAYYVENEFNDFEREILLPHMLSTMGPEIAVGDLNKDGLDDFVVTSPIGKIPTVFIQTPSGSFKKVLSSSFYNHHSTEDSDVHIFDVNGDGNNDMVMSSGGYQWEEGDTALENRLYIGNGLGMFGWVKNGMPRLERSNSGKIIPEDIDGDGDLDFLICGRAFTGKYPYAGTTKILMNENGFFRDRTANIAPQIERLGIVNDACFSDLDHDGDKDILLVGEWMKIEWMENKGNAFVQSKEEIGWPGWWTTIEAVDIDGDGDDDYILGNAGMNNKFNATIEYPLDIYANDFDNNRSLDIVLAKKREEESLPIRGRECSSSQMPFILEKFPTYISFANSDLEDIYGKEKLDQALHYQVTEFHNGILYSREEKGLSFEPFPKEAQFSFLNAYQIWDLNNDGRLDIIGVGNRFNAEVETSRYDAGCGVVLIQQEDGTFKSIPSRESGFFAPHNAKSIEMIKLGKEGKIGFLIGNNNEQLQLFEML